MEYQVPQFIEVEDKVVGPLTLKQFIYLAGGAGLCVIFFTLFPLIVAILLCIPIVALAAALSFYKVNGKNFVNVLEAGFNYIIGSKLFLWRREEAQTVGKIPTAIISAPTTAPNAPRLTSGKLKELAWSLDVQNTGKTEPVD